MQSYHSLSAEVYQLDKPIGSSFGDVEYYAARLQGVQGRILEPAVGTGRILIPLLQQGFAVQGFDPSAAMLDICQQNLKTSGFESSVVFNGQLENFHAQQPYQAIIIPTGSFLLLDQDDKETPSKSVPHQRCIFLVLKLEKLYRLQLAHFLLDNSLMIATHHSY